MFELLSLVRWFSYVSLYEHSPHHIFQAYFQPIDILQIHAGLFITSDQAQIEKELSLEDEFHQEKLVFQRVLLFY